MKKNFSPDFILEYFFNYDILYFDNSTYCKEMPPFSRACKILFEIKIINYLKKTSIQVNACLNFSVLIVYRIFKEKLYLSLLSLI